MLLRPVLSRLHKHQRFANFCILKNVRPSPATASPENVSSPSSLEEKTTEKRYVISYLVNSCGLSPEKAVSASKRVHFDGPGKPNAVLNILGTQGFSKTQIADLVTKLPKVLVSNPENSLLPKIEFFLHSTGISKTEVLTTVSRYPYFLSRSFKNKVAPVYNYLKDIIGAGKADTLLRRGSWIFNLDLENRLIPNVDFMRKLGVSQQSIELALLNFPEIFWPKQVELSKIVEEIKQMGFDPLKTTFIMAIHARIGKGNIALWDQCNEVHSKWGWSKDDIHMAFRMHPKCMLMSEKKTSMALDFLVNKLGRGSRSVARCPYILFHSIGKKIVPRCSIVHLLSSKGLVKKDWSLSSVLCPAEKNFVDKYVTRYNEKLPQLYDIYLSKTVRGVEA